MIPQAKLAESFRRERARQGMSLRDASSATGVNYRTLCMLENDKDSLDMDNFVKVARWLKMPLSEGAVWTYPKNTLDAILDVIRADDNVTDKDSLCTLFSVCYKRMARER